MRSRTQIDNEIYEIIKGKDLSIMKKVIWDTFKKKKLETMDNEQLEILIPLLRRKYENAQGISENGA